MSISKYTYFIICFVCIIFLGLGVNPQEVYSYVPFTAATNIVLTNKPPIGSIVSFEENKYRLSNKPYDSKMVGVVVEQADIIVEEEGSSLADILMINKGETQILVNGETGAIETGDLLTASSTPGQAMKADKDGIIVAVAIDTFHPTNPNDSSLIRGLVDIRFTTLGDTFSADSIGLSDQGMVSTLKRSVSEILGLGPGGLAGTSPIFRYTLATLVVAIAFISGFLLFGRIAMRGVEALGRNPLARRTIMIGIIMNSFFTILLVALAVILAYIIVIV